jgi:hypothetical protein
MKLWLNTEVLNDIKLDSEEIDLLKNILVNDEYWSCLKVVNYQLDALEGSRASKSKGELTKHWESYLELILTCAISNGDLCKEDEKAFTDEVLTYKGSAFSYKRYKRGTTVQDLKDSVELDIDDPYASKGTLASFKGTTYEKKVFPYKTVTSSKKGERDHVLIWQSLWVKW